MARCIGCNASASSGGCCPVPVGAAIWPRPTPRPFWPPSATASSSRPMAATACSAGRGPTEPTTNCWAKSHTATPPGSMLSPVVLTAGNESMQILLTDVRGRVTLLKADPNGNEWSIERVWNVGRPSAAITAGPFVRPDADGVKWFGCITGHNRLVWFNPNEPGPALVVQYPRSSRTGRPTAAARRPAVAGHPDRAIAHPRRQDWPVHRRHADPRGHDDPRDHAGAAGRATPAGAADRLHRDLLATPRLTASGWPHRTGRVNMDWQLLGVGALLGWAVWYVGKQTAQTWFAAAPRGGLRRWLRHLLAAAPGPAYPRPRRPRRPPHAANTPADDLRSRR
jgi:hypothetical protein